MAKKMNPQQAAVALMAEARARYNKGWDIFVECWDIKEIEELVAEQGGYDGARREMVLLVNLHKEMELNCRFE